MRLIYNDAQWKDYNISIDKDRKVVVKCNDKEISKNKRKDILQIISKELDISNTENWNTNKLGINLILFLNRNKTIEEIRDIMSKLLPTIEYEANVGDALSYNQQRYMINNIFKKTSGSDYNMSSVMLRLIVIDSLYSTNAQYSYFSIEEMAKKIIKLGTENNASAYFYKLVCDKNDWKRLFSAKYGIRKNLEDGSRQISLMSKYAYYAILQDVKQHPLGFPIYDSLALAMYPKVCERLAINTDLDSTNVSIEKYIAALNELRKIIFEQEKDDLFEGKYQQYDILDAYLWRMGKLGKGNYSLLLNKSDYCRLIRNLGLEKHTPKTKDIDNYSVDAQSEDNEEQKTSKFNDIIREKTIEKKSNEIVKWMKDGKCIKEMIDHWQKYYI